MEIKLKPISPTFKKRVKPGINPWFCAALVGLLGSWISGTTIEHNGKGIMSQQLSVAITPIAGIITILWGCIAFWWYRNMTARTKTYTLASRGKSDYLTIDDFGVTCGVEDVASTKVAWAAIGFYRLSKSDLVLGLPSSYSRKWCSRDLGKGGVSC